MRYYGVPKRKAVKDWIKDNCMFLEAYNAANRDPELKAEVKDLETKYIRQHLANLVGEDDADRIMSERGYWNGLDTRD